MSWSSSLATPPTLSPTVIIDRGNYSISGTKQHNETIELIEYSPFFKSDRSLKVNRINMESAARIEDVRAEADSKIHRRISTSTATNSRGSMKSSLKTISSISSLRRRPKKFIYTVNNTPAYHEEGAALGNGTSACLVSNCTDFKSCISEVSETTIRNAEKTEEHSSTNKYGIGEKQQIGADKSCIPTNIFHETSCNENLKAESDFTDMPSICLQTNNKKETVIVPSPIVVYQQTESSKNKFPGICHMENLDKDCGGNNVSLTDFSSVQEAILEGSAVAMLDSKKENKERALELAAQHSLTGDTQMAEHGCWSKTDPTNIKELSMVTVSENNLERRQSLSLDLRENATNSKQKRLECMMDSKTKSFGGFKTASNKEIKLFDNNIRKGKLLFSDIEEQFLDDFPGDEVQNASNKNADENAKTSLIRRNELNEKSSDLSYVSDSLMNLIQLSDTQSSFSDCANRTFQNRFKNQETEEKQNLTASQEAEVAELSNILEETGSQFEFTQFREHKTMLYDNTCEVSGKCDQNNINSEVWSDTDFEEAFSEKVQRSDDMSPNKHIDIPVESKIQSQSNADNTLMKSSSRKHIQHFVPVISASLESGVWGCSSSEGKQINMSAEIINKISKPIMDCDKVDEMLNPYKITCQCNSSNDKWGNLNCKKEISADLHQRAKEINLKYMMKNNAKDTNIYIKEHTENKSRAVNLNKIVQVTSTTEVNLKIVKKYFVHVTGNELPCSENNHSALGTPRLSGRGDTLCNYSLQETLSDMTCLGDVAKTEKNPAHSNADEKENFNSNQEGEMINNSESGYLLLKVDTVADGNIVADESKMLHLLTGSCLGEELGGTPGTRSNKRAIASMKREVVLSQNDMLFGSRDPEIYETRKEMQISAVGFQTASGKQIAITDESLAKAKHLLSEETFSPGNQNAVALHPKDNFEEPVDILLDTEKLKTTKELPLDLSAVESDLICCTKKEAMYTVNEDLLANDNLDQIPGKNVSKTLFIDSDTYHDLYVEELGTYSKQVLECWSSRNKSNASVASSNKNLESLALPCNATTETNYIDLKSRHSTLHHSQDASNEKESLPQDLAWISEEPTSSKIFNAENSFGEIPKNKSADKKLLNTNSLHKNSASEEADSVSKVLKARPGAFSTASGKTVRVSEEALKKVKHLFGEDSCKSIKQDMKSQSKTSEHNILESCSDALGSREYVPICNYLGVEKITVENSGASQCPTAKEHCERDQKLQHSASASSNVVSESSCQTVNKWSDTKPSNKLGCSKSDFSIDNCGFFSTASGKAVQLSEESLRKARLLFSEIENDSLGHQTHVSDCDDSYCKISSVRNKGNQNKPLIPQGKRLPNAEVDSNISCGFSTASGKQVHISQKALQNVTELFKEFSDDVSSNGFFVDQQNLGQGHISSIKEPATKMIVEDEIASESKPQDRCNTLYLTTNIPDENNSKNPLSIKIPMCVCGTQKCKHLLEPEKSFSYSKETKPLKTTQVRLGKSETKNSAAHDTAAEGNPYSHCHIYSQIPEDYLELEVSESARAFMEDDALTVSEVEKNKKALVLNSEKNNFYSYRRTGKRCMEKENTFGEPPIKRKLLPEFDQSERSSLKASKSSLDGTMNDRRTCISSISLKPVFCGPSSKERQEVLNPNFTTPGQDLKMSKLDRLQQHITKHSSSRSSCLFQPFSKSFREESKKSENPTAKKPIKVFVPPLKRQSSASEDGINSKESFCLSNNTVPGTEDLNYTEVHETFIQPQKENCKTISAIDSEFRETDSDLTEIITSLHCARNLQEMRILKKQKKVIGPQPGTLYLIKTSAASCRISLKTAVDGKFPGSYRSEQLYAFGVSKQCLNINSSNAEDFHFVIQDFFSRECFLEGHGIQLADEGYLIPSDDGKVGKEEFYRALCDTPGVDPKLISKSWACNHYRWIIWKLAAMEVAFPQEFASKCLTPERVLLQLKYRYDVEVDKSCRSAIKRITERDDVAAKTLILCISRIISVSTNMPHIFGSKSTAEENKRDVAIIEVTDGWYGIRAVLDPSLQSLLYKQKLTVGQKIVTHGAELVGSQDACSPLEAPESLMLKISANSTRCAQWYATLGYYRDPRPFTLPLSSLFSEGGIVGCIDVIIQRIYPTQWMEKLSTGSYVFRNCRAEEREATKHTENRQKTLEALLAKIQAEFEKNKGEGKRVLRSRTLTRQQIRSLQDGAELYEAVCNAADPAYMESYFSEEQLKALAIHRQMVNDKKRAQIEEEFRKAVESAEQDKNSSCRRDVTTLIKLRIVDHRKEEKGKEVTLNIWRPSSHVCSLLKEGNRYKLFHVAASPSKGRSEAATIQLTATKKTQYLQLPVCQEILSQVYKPRECLKFSELLLESFQPACSEVDLVGYVVSLEKGTGFSTLVYLSDKDHNLIAVHICTDLKQFAVEDIIIPSVLISATNLQWRPKFHSNVPTLFAGDHSTFSSNPKETYLQGIFNELRNTVQSNSCFRKDAQCKLATLLQTDGPQVINLPREHDFAPFLSAWKSDAGNKHLIATPNRELRLQSPLALKKLNTKASGSLCSTKVKPELHETPKNSKKRKAMDLLSQVPSPPPVMPICTFISPSLKRAFQPPRSSDTQHERVVKKPECMVGKPALKRSNESNVHLENYFVADEELAMINTQAFLNNITEERG
ncbi:breast cancer type 2 susceptibility protein isoform X2 [Sceloporus undulatus]|nr:breast cancer type 2 susceptibility protein isoform X2 [Sceloporus undulatus]